MASPDDYLLMSGIQHFSFCRRQWALIHLEQQWSENQRTAEGRLQHTRCHDVTLTEKTRRFADRPRYEGRQPPLKTDRRLRCGRVSQGSKRRVIAGPPRPVAAHARGI